MTATNGAPPVRIQLRVGERVQATNLDTYSMYEWRIETSSFDRELIRIFEDWLRLRDRVWREAEIRAFGSLLHRYIFDSGGWSWVDRQIQDAAPAVVRLELVFPADEAYSRLAAVPWEFLYVPDEHGRRGAFLAADNKLVLSRYMPSAQGERRLTTKDSLQVLVVVSQPDDPLLGEVLYEEVVAQIEATVNELHWAPAELVLNPTARGLHERLFADPVPDVIHFMGHGRFDPVEGEAALAFTDLRGGSDSGLRSRSGRIDKPAGYDTTRRCPSRLRGR